MEAGTWRFTYISSGLDFNCSLELKIKSDLQKRELTKAK